MRRGAAGTEPRLPPEPGGRLSLTTAPCLSFPLLANQPTRRVIYKTRCEVSGERNLSTSSRSVAQWPGPAISLTSEHHSVLILGTCQASRMASPGFSASSSPPSDLDTPQGAGFLHTCCQHLQSGLPRGWLRSARLWGWLPPRGRAKEVTWLQLAGGEGPNLALPLPLNERGDDIRIALGGNGH